MSEPLSVTMQAIMADPKRKIDNTIDLTFPDATSFKFATSPLTISGLGTYTNDLETVGEINRTIESPIDRVAIGIQNEDRVMGLHVATYWQKWRKAEAVVGRYYRGGPNMSLFEWVERFRGSVQKPNANDMQVIMDIIPDTVSPGLIVSSHALGQLCGWVFKDLKTCAYAGLLTTCNHLLKSPDGCDGRNNSEHFGGMEDRNNPDLDIPGTGGNPIDPPGPPTGSCPRLDQYTRVKGPDGKPMVKMVGFCTEEDFLWHPILRRFYPLKTARIVKDQPIFELLTNTGAAGYSSFPHPVLWHRSHETGEPVSKFSAGDPVLGEIRGKLIDMLAILALSTGETGDVMRLEMDAPTTAEKIYCYGDNPDKMIVCHNAKPIEVFLS